MSERPSPSSDIAFTPAVKAVQERLGSRAGYEQMEAKGGWQTTITADLAAFLAERNSAYLATATAQGQPYVQHRGGPRGFIKALDEHTLGFADFGGNKQYISLGNLSENDRAHLFVMDYLNQRRVKIWGRARMVENDPDLVAHLAGSGYRAKPERALLFSVEAWDVNCPQHIPRMAPVDELAETVGRLRARIAELEAELAVVRLGNASPAKSD